MMQNLLLVFPNKLNDQNGFEQIIDRFDKKGYDIHVFDDINYSELGIDVLPSVIEYLKQQYLQEHNAATGRIVILSNVKEVVFAWYRCYNSLVDDFIFFIDSENNACLPEDNATYLLFYLLSSFVGIQNENIEGKIYLNINIRNYASIYHFMLNQKNFRFFDRIENYDFDKNRTKTSVIKSYKYKSNVFEFKRDNHDSGTRVDLVDLDIVVNQDTQFDQEFIRTLDNNPYFISYLMSEFYELRCERNANLFLVDYLEHFAEISPGDSRKLCQEILCLVRDGNIEFSKEVYFLSLSVLLSSEEPVLKGIMQALVNNDTYVDYHFSILASTTGYISKDNLSLYPEYYRDFRTVRTKIAGSFGKNLDLTKPNKPNSGYVAILVDQLKEHLHAPTKVILDYAVNLKKVNPGFKIKIFVEDNLFHKEVVIPYHYSVINSGNFKEVHNEYLRRADIEIFYPDPALSRKELTISVAKEIIEFNPEILFTTSELSVTRQMLALYYPTVYMSHGAVVFTSMADVYLYPNKEEEAVQVNREYDLINTEFIHEFRAGIDFTKPVKKISRSDLNLLENEFIMITVGTRLDAEMDNAFMDAICSFLTERQDCKWVIVGQAKLPYLNNRDLGNQIIRIPFESDLPSLYRICDAYLNPVRRGGGFSIAMAMNEGLPVVIMGQPSDGLEYVGEENSSGTTMEEYVNDLRLLYEDKEYQKYKGNLMKTRVSKFDMECSIKQLLEFFELAKKRFAARTRN